MGNSGSTALGPCNGNVALCSRQYSSVTQIGTHNSAFVGILPTDNQQLSVVKQLDAGIRFLQAQTHSLSGELYLCHTTCEERNAGPLTNYLATIKTWMDSNPDQVVTLLLTNGDRVDVNLFGNAMQSTSLAKHAYTPPHKLAISEWPTLQKLIDDKTRLVIFLDYLADTSKVPYILDEFSYFFETAYDVTKFDNCNLDRPPGSNGDGLMMLVNHFKDIDLFGIFIPDVASTPKTNAAFGAESIGEQSDLCIAKWNRQPNMILVDNFNLGDVFTAERNLNHL